MISVFCLLVWTKYFGGMVLPGMVIQDRCSSAFKYTFSSIFRSDSNRLKEFLSSSHVLTGSHTFSIVLIWQGIDMGYFLNDSQSFSLVLKPETTFKQHQVSFFREPYFFRRYKKLSVKMPSKLKEITEYLKPIAEAFRNCTPKNLLQTQSCTNEFSLV